MGFVLNFVSVQICDETFPALIDSGASRTFINQEIEDKVLGLDFRVKKGCQVTVISPLGAKKIVDENIKLPITLNTHSQKINVRVLPLMQTPFILEVDALRAFGLNIHF